MKTKKQQTKSLSRLLLVDVDGTTVDPRKRLLPEVKLALREAQARGLHVAFATGRMYRSIAHWVQELGLRTPQITNNGADIVDPRTGNYLERRSLAGEMAVQVLAAGHEMGASVALFRGDAVYAWKKTADHWLLERNNEPVTEIPYAELIAMRPDAEKLLFLDIVQPERLYAVRDELARRFRRPDGSLPFYMEITESGILNICHPEASKKMAMQRLCQHLRIPLSAVAAIGDSENDSEMVAAAGLGIAMGNAVPDTLRGAKHVAPTNAEIGVIPAICETVLGGVEPGTPGDLALKLRRLRLTVRGYGSALVAFYGGVDSTLALKLVADELGPREESEPVPANMPGVLAVTARSSVLPQEEMESAVTLAREFGVVHEFLDTEALNAANWYETNPSDRCYICKKGFFGTLAESAKTHGFACVVDGENADDLRASDRPGRRAAIECGVRSPLAEAGLTKADVRAISRELGLPTWDRPANACLATRFPHGIALTPERLAAVGRAESALRALGFRQLRVRVHGDVARLELEPGAIAEAAKRAAEIAKILKGNGFRHAALDLDGYRTGSMG